MLTWLSAYVEQPEVLLIVIPLLLLSLIIITKDFGKRDRETYQQRRRMKIFLFITRGLIFALLIMALASPYTFYQKFMKGEPAVVFLVDNSSSYTLFEKGRGQYVYDQLKQHVDVELREFGDMEKTPLGDELQSSLRKGKSVLVLSDGQVTHGISLGDVLLQAKELNTTINVIKLDQVEKDYSIIIDGPSKISSGVETEYDIIIEGLPLAEHDILVSVDGKEEFTKRVNEDFSFTKIFSEGYHTIKAEILVENDEIKQNNVFYKSVKVVPKPKINLITFEDTPLTQLFYNIYDIEKTSTVSNQNNEYAVVLNDIPLDAFQNDVSSLQSFVSNGNGLVVFGGFNSFERGQYKDSQFENLLPTIIASAEKQGGGNSVVIVIDISGSTGSKTYTDPDTGELVVVGTDDKINLEKALAVSLLNSIGNDAMVGVVAFGSGGAYVVKDLDFLFSSKQALTDKIASLQYDLGGNAFIGDGIASAIEMLKSGAGSKTIILLSDGSPHRADEIVCNPPYFDPVWDANPAQHKDEIEDYEEDVKECEEKAVINRALGKGITLYTIGIGVDVNENFMKLMAKIGNGEYVYATEKNKLNLVIGKATGDTGDDIGYSVVVKDKKHFITENLKTHAKIYGFNEGVPKASAQLLVTTDQGDPLLVAWRYGLGRVVTILTDDGDAYAGELLNKQNSKLLLRALSWAVGDPERKSNTFITIPDGRVGEQIEVTYKGDQPPQGTISFSKTEEDSYHGYLDAKVSGFHQFWQATYAVNEPLEYEHVGFNPELEQLAQETHGKVFDGQNIQDMITTLQSQSKEVILEKWQYQQPFVILALLIFLLEICVRRMLYFRRR